MQDDKSTTVTSGVTATLGGVTLQPGGVNALSRPDVNKGTKALAWPAAIILAVVPTANVQIPVSFFLSSETCVCSYTRKKDHGLDSYAVYSSWYVPRWEEIMVPQMQTVGHIKANLKFRGSLKWLPYNP
jgi:hypothetical protein